MLAGNTNQADAQKSADFGDDFVQTYNIQFPIKTIEEFDEFNIMLEMDTACRSKFVSIYTYYYLFKILYYINHILSYIFLV